MNNITYEELRRLSECNFEDTTTFQRVVIIQLFRSTEITEFGLIFLN